MAWSARYERQGRLRWDVHMLHRLSRSEKRVHASLRVLVQRFQFVAQMLVQIDAEYRPLYYGPQNIQRPNPLGVRKPMKDQRVAQHKIRHGFVGGNNVLTDVDVLKVRWKVEYDLVWPHFEG